MRSRKGIFASTVLTAVLIQGVMFSANALEFIRNGKEITLKTKRLEAIVKDGRIIQMKYRGDKTLFANRTFNEQSDTAGIGCISKSRKSRRLLSRYHRKFGDAKVTSYDPIKLGTVAIYRSACEKSVFQLKKDKDKVIASWKGLSNGKTFFPEDKISIEFGEDANGALTFRGAGTAPGGGVFAVQIPIENLSPQGRFILPTYGGMEYSASEGAKTLMTFMSTSCFYDAPLMTYELGKHALGMWSEDKDFNPLFAFFRRGKRSCAFSLEFLNIIPYEVRNASNSPLIKLDIFPNCGWIEAARPYRDWYQKTFAKEIAKRDNSCFKDIQAILEYGGTVPAGIYNDPKQIASLFDPHKILVHWWSIRKLSFDVGTPDYTLHPNAVKYINNTKRLGFRNSAYFNPLCANYNCAAWKRDNLSSFVLTRKNTIASYKTGNAGDIAEMLGGTIDKGSEKDQFDGISTGNLLYLDPLPKTWRKYIVKVNKKLLTESGLDAFYHDCLGVAEDTGNGVVDGISGSMANAELARTLQNNVKVPFWSEYGPASVAFATNAPLIGQGWYKNIPDFIKQRIHKQYPLSAFLFGYRPTGHQTNPDDLIMHCYEATMDSLCGLALFPPGSFRIKKGFKDHRWLRCKVFLEYNLKPFYPKCRYPENIHAMYKAKDGSIFHYYDDGKLQMMLDASKCPLYGRFDGGTEVNTKDLVLPGWPCVDKNGIYGLNSESNYALFPKTDKTVQTSVTVEKPEDKISIKSYYESPEFAYCEIAARSPELKKTKLNLNVSEKYKTVSVNDMEMPAQKKMKIETKLPARLVFSTGNISSKKPLVREISPESGLEKESSEKLGPSVRIFKGIRFYQPYAAHVKSIDFLRKVNDPQSALELYFQFCPFQGKDGDGSIVSLFVNGEKLRSFDSVSGKNRAYKRRTRALIPRYVSDYNMHKWIVPIGKYHGKTILISLRIDNKRSSYRDRMRITLPKIIHDPSQKFTDTIEEKIPWKYYKYTEPLPFEGK